VKCSVCGEIITAPQTIPATGHTKETIAAVAATCTKAGTTAGVKCSVCGEILTAPTTIAATGHDWGTGKVTKEATTTAKGTKTYTCKNCGKAKTEAIAKLDIDFPDVVEGAWFSTYVDKMATAGLIAGYDDGSYRPDSPLTRAQVAQILYRRANEPAVSGTVSYSDVADNAWYTSAIIWATQQGIIKGDPDGKFRPNDPVARQELAIILWRDAGEPTVADDLGNFKDVDTYDEAIKALRWAVQQGIMQGDAEAATLRPRDGAKRSEASKMLCVYLGL
jgi:hypothetical protein